MKDLSQGTKNKLIFASILLGVPALIIDPTATSGPIIALIVIAGILLVLGLGGFAFLGGMMILTFFLGVFDPTSSPQDYFGCSLVGLVGLSLLLPLLIQAHKDGNDKKLQMQTLKSRLRAIRFCPNCVKTVSMVQALYRNENLELFGKVYELSRQSGSIFEKNYRKVIRVGSSKLCRDCSRKLKSEIREHLKEFSAFDFEQLDLPGRDIEDDESKMEAVSLKECPHCCEEIDVELSKCPFCAEGLE